MTLSRFIGYEEDLWGEHRYSAVVAGNLLKFAKNLELREYILGTGSHILVEASPIDKIWGVSKDHPNSDDPNTWKGLNLLGFALMEVRELLRMD